MGMRLEFCPWVKKMENILPGDVAENLNKRTERLILVDVPKKLARNIACMLLLVSILDIVRITKSCSMTLEAVARLYFLVGEDLGLGWLRYNAEKLPVDNYWHKLAATALIEELYNHQRVITASIINRGNGSFEGWKEKNVLFVNKTNSMLNDFLKKETGLFVKPFIFRQKLIFEFIAE